MKMRNIRGISKTTQSDLLRLGPQLLCKFEILCPAVFHPYRFEKHDLTMIKNRVPPARDGVTFQHYSQNF